MGRLALACKDASGSVDYIHKTFMPTVLQVALWLEHSHVRTGDLKDNQAANGERLLKIVKMLEARWLSSERAVTALHESLASVITTMEDPKRKKDGKSAATGFGCAKVLRSFKFIATLELFRTVLPELAELSRVFQTRDLDFTAISSRVSVTRQSIEAKAQLASSVKDHLQALKSADAKAAAALVPPNDPLMHQINVRLEALKGKGVEIREDNETRRREFAAVRAQWLRALVDGLNRRFPAPQLFSDLATLFDPKNLPASIKDAVAGDGLYGAAAVAGIAEHLSTTRRSLPALAEQLAIVQRKAADHNKAVKAASKAAAKAAANASAAENVEMLAVEETTSLAAPKTLERKRVADPDIMDLTEDGDDSGAQSDGKSAKGEGKDSKGDGNAANNASSPSSSSASNSSTAAKPAQSSPSAAAANTAKPAYADSPYVDKAVLQSEWSTALRFLIDIRDNDPVLKHLRATGEAVGTKHLLHRFVVQPANWRTVPETCKVICFALSLPVTTADCERGFSLMNLLKNDLRNRIASSLSPLMRIASAGPPLTSPAIDWNAILYRWYHAKLRKVYLNLAPLESPDKDSAEKMFNKLPAFVASFEDVEGGVEMEF